MSQMSLGVVRSLGVGRFLDWGVLNARGAVGGVLVFWDKRVLELEGMEVGLFSISCRFKNCEDGFSWIFSGVYGPTLKRYKELFWEELGAIRGLWSDPWCIRGDFNLIRFPNESRRGGRLSSSMRRFSEVIDDLDLRDLPLQGGPFTWSGGLNNQAMSRLDRFLVSKDWEGHFKGAVQCTLPRPVSDHFPILLDGGGVRRGPVPFRFENMWLKEEGFKDLLKRWWQRLSFNGSFSFILAEKFKALKAILKSWNKDVFGQVGVNKKLALDKVNFWDGQEKLRPLSLEELEARKVAKGDFEKWALMEEIKVDGVWLTEEQEIKRGVVRAFKDQLTDPGGWHPSMEGLDFNRIGDEDAARLEEVFSEEEVFKALSDLNGDKAPGPDGFPLRFVRSLNSTFLVLIPKKAGAEDLRDFRPISLVGGLYKLLAKVLANRLKKVVGKVVSSAQNAFVEGRQILDAALIANEAIDYLLKRNESGVLCKLDLEKAYDHINWNFLLFVLQSMGFGEKWTGWISWCISTTTFSVLINGTPEGYFNSSRGLRCRVNGRGGDGALVSHLLFADDTLVFCEASEDQMVHLSWLLMWFEAISGLRINLDKSEILPVGRVENSENLALEAGCKVGRLPSSYLGIPLGANHKSVAVWDGVEERFRKRLALWKRQFISKGGRITLIRSTLSRGALERKPHLVNWDTVCMDKRKGGLGVRRLSILNRALLCKWNWRFANERENFWRHVISRKFGEEEGGWGSRDVRESYGVGFWKEIRKEGALMQNKVVFSVGSGRRVKFWKDLWWGNFALCNSFPSLYAIASSKEAWVEEFWDTSGVEGVWSPRFSRPFNDWEVEEVERLLLTIRGAGLNPLMEDRMMWNVTSNGIFSVKSLYNDLSSRRAGPFPHGLIWSPSVPSKVSFFTWEASWGKVLTMDQLKKRGWALANRCFLCCEEEESIDHILIHCSRARALWEFCSPFLGCFGSSHLRLKIPLLNGGALCWARSIERCGRQPRCAFFGRFGWKETGLLSIMRTFRFIG
ncbi:Transposon TX1 uncharacterized 149 kDa protein [Vitis vinifera]|uniref:Transposon TX1 uncharacterized 149 kDa protein n=1 Tax=Vitis vinifera TaxID=29760 RepID=A0A438KEY7_VITVI|nr:Transposon TX1 uncharacterized 149 kDa protein [Vitis vinifera]